MVSKVEERTGRRATLLLAAIMGALLLSSGAALAATITCQAGADCIGTKNADTLEGTASYDNMYGRGGGDTLKGFGAFDELYGQSGSDKLFGGPGDDDLIGGSGQDTLSGGGGLDLYYFGPGWGKDYINEGSTPAYGVAFDGGSYFHLGTNVTDSVTDGLTIRFVPGTGPEARTEDGANTVNWESNAISLAVGGAGGDDITGSSSGNLIIGAGGSDTIHGAGGDDEIDADDGSLGDTVHCGAGDDVVSYDVEPVTVVSDIIASDCEHLYPQNL